MTEVSREAQIRILNENAASWRGQAENLRIQADHLVNAADSAEAEAVALLQLPPEAPLEEPDLEEES